MLNHEINQSNLKQSKIAYSVSFEDYEEALKKIQILEEEVNRLKEQLLLMQQRKFGKKSESHVGEPIVDPDNQPLQNVSGYVR
ncbi:MAG: hypothetical protein ACR2HS_00870 [Gammaproteobacteria bacterium]